MPIDTWIWFIISSTALLIIPGPTILLVVFYAINQGRKVAVAMALGVALGDFVAMTASLLGLGILVLASATLFTVLKWLGAAYLICLGIKLLRSPPAGFQQTQTTKNTDKSGRELFLHAFAVTALNPKSITFFIAFVPQFINPATGLALQFSLLISSFVILATINALAYALLADRLRSRIKRPSVMKWMNRIGGSALIAMGIISTTLKRS